MHTAPFLHRFSLQPASTRLPFCLRLCGEYAASDLKVRQNVMTGEDIPAFPDLPALDPKDYEEDDVKEELDDLAKLKAAALQSTATSAAAPQKPSFFDYSLPSYYKKADEDIYGYTAKREGSSVDVDSDIAYISQQQSSFEYPSAPRDTRKRAESYTHRPRASSQKRKERLFQGPLPHDVSKKLKQAVQLESPEDIAKYVEERKKKFPTRQNVIQKQREEAARLDRGELKLDTEETFLYNREQKEVPKEEKPAPCCIFYLQNICSKGKLCPDLHDPVLREEHLKQQWSKPEKKGSLIVPKASKSLLKKLLEKTIRAEYSIVLQGIRHLVRHHPVFTLPGPTHTDPEHVRTEP